jgi:hypothetical protein
MDAETVARKLRPLMPHQVDRWMSARQVANAELRALIDRQIFETASQVLGDYKNKPLLSLPAKALAAGPLNVGTVVYEKDHGDLGLSPDDIIRHVLVCGSTGAGKTNLALHLLMQLAERGTPFLFLDFKKSVRAALPHLGRKVKLFTVGSNHSPLAFNPFVVPPQLEEQVYVGHLVDAMSDAFQLGEASRRLTQKVILNCYQQGQKAPTPRNVIAGIEALPARERIHGWKITALRALETLAMCGLSGQAGLTQQSIATQFLEGQSILELDGLDHRVRRFIVPLLCLWLYLSRLGMAGREELKCVVLVEECHHFFLKGEQRWKESLMGMLLRQCRELGIGFVLLDQRASALSGAALQNCATSICLAQRHGADVSAASSLLGLHEAEKHWLTELAVGQGIIRLGSRWQKPVLVKLPLVPIRKRQVSDEELRHSLEGRWPSDTAPLAQPEHLTSAAVTGRTASTLGEDALTFLHDVTLHPHDGVKDRYQRLRMSVDKGNRTKGQLLRDGWLDVQTVPVGKSRKRLLRLTVKAKRLLGNPSPTADRESIAHAYWKHVYAQRYQELGYFVQVEAPRVGGHVDILAKRGRERIGIEIETGRSDVTGNVRHGLREGFDTIIVVCVDRQALDRCESVLAREGLLIPGRIQTTRAATTSANTSATATS